MKHFNDVRSRRRKQMAQEYVDYQCNYLYFKLCGECHAVEITEQEKEDMIRRAKKTYFYNYKLKRK